MFIHIQTHCSNLLNIFSCTLKWIFFYSASLNFFFSMIEQNITDMFVNKYPLLNNCNHTRYIFLYVSMAAFFLLSF